jgi:ArsR family transcriptional regulator
MGGQHTMNQDQVVKIFKALANETRLKILEAIGNNQMECSCCPQDVGLFDVEEGAICCVEEIVDKFNMAQSTISQHLKELYNAGLLERHKKAQWVYYTINRQTFEELREYLRQIAFGLAQKA